MIMDHTIIIIRAEIRGRDVTEIPEVNSFHSKFTHFSQSDFFPLIILFLLFIPGLTSVLYVIIQPQFQMCVCFQRRLSLQLLVVVTG